MIVMQLRKLFILLSAVVFLCIGCKKESAPPPVEPENDFLYFINIEMNSYYDSPAIFPTYFQLVHQTSPGNYEYWSLSYHGTQAACDVQAITFFDSILANIDNDSVCLNIIKADYIKAILCRQEHNSLVQIKARQWTSTGVLDF